MALADVIEEVLFLRQVWRFMLLEVGTPCMPVFENIRVRCSLRRTPLPTPTPSTSTCDSTSSGNWLGEKSYLVSIIHVPSPFFQHADFPTKAISRESFGFTRSLAMALW